ncbi:MAG: outer membrane protein assembly factor BamC [Burkholderiaceae bacterium]
MTHDTPQTSSPATPVRSLRMVAGTATVLALLSGCSTIGDLFGGSGGGTPIDYRSKAVKTPPLEVPPDLSQIAREGRFDVQAGRPVSASTFGQPGASGPASTAGPSVTPQEVGSVRLVREGEQRRLLTSLAPEVVYQRALAFWKDAGFGIETERPEAGIIETGWAENRANLPKDFVRNLLGRFADGLFSTGERDRFRTRIERNGAVTEIVVTHRGLVEGPVGNNREQIAWQPRASDSGLEAEMTYRLMARLGAPEAAVQQARAEDRGSARPATAAGATAARAAVPRARQLPDGRLQIDEGFDRAWRTVGAGLDRGGFTVEDRDRAGGIYFVRYIDRNAAAGSGWFNRLFDAFRSDDSKTRVARYRIVVKEEAAGKSVITVLDANGRAEESDTVRAIRAALLKELQ